MRNPVRSIFLAGALMAPALAQGAAVAGYVTDGTCGPFVDLVALGGELYATKISVTATDVPNDFMFDLSAPSKGGGVTTGASITPANGWNIDEAWRATQLISDAHFIYITFPPAGPGQPGRLFFDSGSLAINFFFDLGAVREVGNALPAGQGNTSGLTLPSNSSATYTFGGKTFPAGSTTNGINVMFAPFTEVNNTEAVAGSGCFIGGAVPLPSSRAPASVQEIGAIIGYNVWRIPGTAGTVPTPADFKAAFTSGGGGWQYFMDLQQLRLATADNNTGTAGTVSPIELAPNDLAGLQNPDGLVYNGDELLFFQDSPSNRGSARVGGTPPSTTGSYWYAFQPVIYGRVADFPATLTFGVSGQFAGQHQLDTDGDGSMDTIDLDPPSGTAEFISPQAEAGFPGLGLTNQGFPLLSSPVFYDGPATTLPAFGQVSLSGAVSGNSVSLQFTTGLEKGTVLGYNVYRLSGDQRVRVNEQPILAQGNESNAYQLVDAAVRGRGVRSMQYSVEIVYADGTAPTMVGPFTVTLDQQPTRRRH